MCSMLDCGKPLGPDALEFTHKGEPAGGICENCLEDDERTDCIQKENKGTSSKRKMKYITF